MAIAELVDSHGGRRRHIPLDSHEGIKMLPKPIEKTGRAIVSAASTARPVFEMGLSVAGKGGFPVEPISFFLPF